MICGRLAADRSEYELIRTARPDQATCRAILDTYLENCHFADSRRNAGYIGALGFRP